MKTIRLELSLDEAESMLASAQIEQDEWQKLESRARSPRTAANAKQEKQLWVGISHKIQEAMKP